jgi:Protein of unknown function (DUF551)
MADWQPIETAPKDRPFLIYWQQSLIGQPCVDIVSWQEYQEILGYGEPPATHWMPLPDPPEERKANG